MARQWIPLLTAAAVACSDGVDGVGAVTTSRCPVPDSEAETSLGTLELELPDHPLPDRPFPVTVRSTAELPPTAAVNVCVDGELRGTLQLYRGRGSLTLSLPEGNALLELATRSVRTRHDIQVEARPLRELSGQLPDGEHVWSADEDIVIHGDLQLTAASHLVVQAGARLSFDARAALEVLGRLEVQGTAERPVLFTRAGAEAWGGIRLLMGSSARLEHAWFVAAGGDTTRAWGHSHSQPVLWIEQAELAVHGGGVLDSPGKAFGSYMAHVELDGVLVSRCDTGGEFAKSELHVAHGHVLEMPDADRQLDDDDNDGIYVSGVALDDAGEPLESSIEDMVFAVGEDDGIDHNNALLRVERVWIEGFSHEGIAASHGHRVAISEAVVRGNGQGIEAGYGTPQVSVSHSLLTDNDVGLRFGDSYKQASAGSLHVQSSIITGNRTDVKNYADHIAGPVPMAIEITCSIVGDEAEAIGGEECSDVVVGPSVTD